MALVQGTEELLISKDPPPSKKSLPTNSSRRSLQEIPPNKFLQKIPPRNSSQQIPPEDPSKKFLPIKEHLQKSVGVMSSSIVFLILFFLPSPNKTTIILVFALIKTSTKTRIQKVGPKYQMTILCSLKRMVIWYF